ncbi:kinetochore protein SLK19 isoform X2 [Lingula anatina]|uniref:Kinetochore protein SLK19 isoform X2 n=1 Tax=Lingula anatina TaxID=7574 RepID=A0A1S3HFS3_LINAN|nr:kinetochore protein SLK19 isoform X2 [Lingula anatina]|eukprot:XP_013384905.1 kinetochore protein SLK19 isoform X2 [Lingula anatina]
MFPHTCTGIFSYSKETKVGRDRAFWLCRNIPRDLDKVTKFAHILGNHGLGHLEKALLKGLEDIAVPVTETTPIPESQRPQLDEKRVESMITLALEKQNEKFNSQISQVMTEFNSLKEDKMHLQNTLTQVTADLVHLKQENDILKKEMEAGTRVIKELKEENSQLMKNLQEETEKRKQVEEDLNKANMKTKDKNPQCSCSKKNTLQGKLPAGNELQSVTSLASNQDILKAQVRSLERQAMKWKNRYEQQRKKNSCCCCFLKKTYDEDKKKH